MNLTAMANALLQRLIAPLDHEERYAVLTRVTRVQEEKQRTLHVTDIIDLYLTHLEEHPHVTR